MKRLKPLMSCLICLLVSELTFKQLSQPITSLM